MLCDAACCGLLSPPAAHHLPHPPAAPQSDLGRLSGFPEYSYDYPMLLSSTKCAPGGHPAAPAGEARHRAALPPQQRLPDRPRTAAAYGPLPGLMPAAAADASPCACGTGAARKLKDLPFVTVLPGHGRRVRRGAAGARLLCLSFSAPPPPVPAARVLTL